MDKEIIIILSYCDDENKIQELENLLTSLKSINIDILLYAKYPISFDIQKYVKFYIYENDNPIIYDKHVLLWELSNNKKITHVINYDWGYAVFDQIKKSISISNSLRYDISYVINYDVNANEVYRFIQNIKTKLKKNHAVFYPHGQNGLLLTSMVFKIRKVHKSLNNNINLINYKKYDSSLVAEEIFHDIIKNANIKYNIINDGTNPSTSIAVTKNLYGTFNQKNYKTLKYLNRCFLGMNQTIGLKVIYVYQTIQKIKSMVINIGDTIIEYNNIVYHGDDFELLISDYEVKKLEILEINDEKINEVIYEKIQDNHFLLNVINNI